MAVSLTGRFFYSLMSIRFAARIASWSRDVVQILQQRQINQVFKQPTRLRVDDHGAVRGEERRDLLLRTEGDLPHERDGTVDP